MILNTHYAYGGGSANQAVIVVTAPTGSTVTATLEGNVLTAQEINGTWTFKVRKFGVYTVKATLGNQTASTTVNVTEAKTYEVKLAYTFTVTLTSNGKQSTNDGYIRVNNVSYYNTTTLALNPGTAVSIYAYYDVDVSTYSGLFLNGTRVSTNRGRQSTTINIERDMSVNVNNTSAGRYAASRTDITY